MSTGPTAREVWRRLVDEAGEDEIAAVLSLTQEQVDAELAADPGFDPKEEQLAADLFLEDLASGAIDARLGLTPEEQPTSAVVAIARAIDPDGDDTPQVRSTRQRAIDGILGKPPTSDKPPTR